MTYEFSEFVKRLDNSHFDKIIFNDFLDYLYSNQSLLEKNIFEDEPQFENLDKIQRARFAAHIHYLSKKLCVNTPDWVYDSCYYLDNPVFDMNAKGKLKLVLLYESPMEYRQRNIFTNNQPLRRA